MEGIVVFFGLIASGKSTLAEAYAHREQVSYLNTGRVRKELLDIGATENKPAGMGEGIYTPEMTRRTYQSMLDQSATMLKQGRGVVLDGSYASHRERELVVRCGAFAGVSVRFVLCQCSDEETRKRLEMRRLDPEAVSDGRWQIFIRQKDIFELPDEVNGDHLLVLDTEVDLNILARKVAGWLCQS